MKKPGQPDNALEITTGRRCVLVALKDGVAQRAEMSMAANWLRDLYAHRRIKPRILERDALYNRLMTGEAHEGEEQEMTRTWINHLIEGALSYLEQENIMAIEDDEDKLISAGMRATLPVANSTQVGGTHYAKPIQHWDFVASNEYGYLEGQITKYVFRWRDKNGIQDLQKAAHFLQKLIEVSAGEVDNPIRLQDFLDANNIPENERSIYVALHAYHHTLDNVFLAYANDAMKRLLATAGAPHPS